MEILQKITAILLTPLFALASWSGVLPKSEIIIQEPQQIQQEKSFGAFSPTGGSTYRLKTSLSSTDTSITLSSFKEPTSNTPYNMTYLGTTIGYGTIEPMVSGKSEFISFTGITQNSDGSATLTGVTRGLTRTPSASACVASTTLALRHAAQSTFILPDSPCLFAEYAAKKNNETITGYWSGPTPISAGNFAIKSYVDSVVNGGAVSYDSLVVAGNAGETISTGTVLYFNRYEGEWRKASASLASTSQRVLLGLAQGSGTDGNSINSGVLIKGLDTNNIGGTSGNFVFLSDTSGATSTSQGTLPKVLGMIKSPTEFYFDSNFYLDLTSYNQQASTTQITNTGNAYLASTTATQLNVSTTTSNFFTSIQKVFATTTTQTTSGTTETTMWGIDLKPALLKDGKLNIESVFEPLNVQTNSCSTNYVKLYLGSTVVASSTLIVGDESYLRLKFSVLDTNGTSQVVNMDLASSTNNVFGAINVGVQDRAATTSATYSLNTNNPLNLRMTMKLSAGDAADCRYQAVYSYGEIIR